MVSVHFSRETGPDDRALAVRPLAMTEPMRCGLQVSPCDDCWIRRLGHRLSLRFQGARVTSALSSTTGREV